MSFIERRFNGYRGFCTCTVLCFIKNYFQKASGFIIFWNVVLLINNLLDFYSWFILRLQICGQLFSLQPCHTHLFTATINSEEQQDQINVCPYGEVASFIHVQTRTMTHYSSDYCSDLSKQQAKYLSMTLLWKLLRCAHVFIQILRLKHFRLRLSYLWSHVLFNKNTHNNLSWFVEVPVV